MTIICKARAIIRKVGVEQLADHITEQRVKEAVTDFVNYYWEIAEVIETGWADDAYIYERFRTTLEELYPAFEKVLDTEDATPSLRAAFEAITTLHLRWRTEENERRKMKSPISQRIKSLKEQLNRTPLSPDEQALEFSLIEGTADPGVQQAQQAVADNRS